MAGAYRKLFDIVCQHGYFGDQPCPPVQLQPTPACRRLLERYRLLWRALPGGLELHYPETAALVPLASFNETQPLTFTLTSSDPALLSYTDVALAAPGLAPAGIYYFDNLDSAASGLLHPAGRPFHEGRLRLADKRLDFPAGHGAGLAVHDHLDRRQAWPPAPELPPSAAIDLGDLAEGRYSLARDRTPLFDFYLGRALASGSWGVVAIYPGGKAQPARGFPIGVDGAVVPQSYRIALGPRRVTWRYYVVGRSASQPAPAGKVLALDHRTPRASLEPPAEFSALPESVLVNGRRATVFVSDRALALSALPDSSLSYCFRPSAQGMEQGAQLALPYPGPGALAAAGQGPGWCADVYLYL
jgi:hypothetical protein